MWKPARPWYPLSLGLICLPLGVGGLASCSEIGTSFLFGFKQLKAGCSGRRDIFNVVLYLEKERVKMMVPSRSWKNWFQASPA